MTEEQDTGAQDNASLAPSHATAGAQLRAARESHGLSIDTVAQHLKLAPRQVRALEDEDFGQLPGRTFIRGFARNYARLMHLDPEAIMAALPGADAVPALDKPAIGSSARAMGELPVSQDRRRRAWARWAIPIAIAALIGVAAVYEIRRDEAQRVAVTPVSPARAPADAIGPVTGTSALPNPLGGSDASGAQPPFGMPSYEPATATGPAEDQGAVRAQDTSSSSPAIPAAGTPSTTPAPAAEATLVISYRARAWTEVRDANGQRLLAVTGAAGTTETVSGTPPFELTVGNAAQASIRWRGAAFDLAPHVKGNVARVRLN